MQQFEIRPPARAWVERWGGRGLQDVWDDISPINSQAQERLGYPTQKPEALLERIVNLNSHEGDTILDPFCGCGAVVAVAQRLGRKWIGIDITYLAITLIRHRLFTAYQGKAEYEVIGEPVSLPDVAARLNKSSCREGRGVESGRRAGAARCDRS